MAGRGSSTPPLRRAPAARAATSEDYEDEQGEGGGGLDAPVTEFEAVQKLADRTSNPKP